MFTWRSSLWFDDMAIFKTMTAGFGLRPGSHWRCAVAEIIRRDAGRKIQGAHNSTNDSEFLRLIEKQLVDQKTTSLVSLMFAVFTCGSPCIYSKMGSQWTQDSKAADERNWHDLREEWTKCVCSDSFKNCNRTATGNGSQQRTCFQRACRAAEPKCPNLGLFLDLLMFHLSVWFYTHSNFWNTTKDLEPWFAIGSVCFSSISPFSFSFFLPSRWSISRSFWPQEIASESVSSPWHVLSFVVTEDTVLHSWDFIWFLMTLCCFLSFYSCVFVPTSVLSAKGVLRKNDIAQNRRFFSQQAATAAGTYGDCNAGSEVVHWKRANGFAEGTVKLLKLFWTVLLFIVRPWS